jgi:hypothetical protein
MADSKITALTAISTVDPTADPLVIVDVSDTSMAASGTTKKSTINQLLGAGGTATLASATITGDLTVDTSTLKVDSANNRVGILTATPAAGYALDVRGILAAGNSAGTIIGGISFSTRPEIGAISNHSLGLIANNTTMHLITPAGVFDWYDGAGGTRMTLNSTGLGVGVTPSAKLHINGDIRIEQSTTPVLDFYTSTTKRALIKGTSSELNINSLTSNPITFTIDTTERARLDASGNLLVGTTSLISGTAAGSINIAGANSQQIVIRNTDATAGAFWRQAVDSGNTFYVLNNASTGVSITSGATSWSAVSDERLKDIIEPISNAIAKVGSLRSVIGKYKNDETNTRRSFLIAQDVLSVLPEAVDSSKSNELGLRYSELIPLLVAAIKELTARVEALEA